VLGVSAGAAPYSTRFPASSFASHRIMKLINRLQP
jgi:hypothetical protein